jgi:hypothetical protein
VIDEIGQRIGGGHCGVDLATGNCVKYRKVAIDGWVEASAARDLRVIDPADPTEDRMQRPKCVLQKGLSRGIQDDPVDSPIEDIELADRHSIALIAERTSKMHNLIAVRGSGTLGSKPDNETLDVAPDLQQDALTREIDGRDLKPVPRADNDKRISREPADCLVHRCSPIAGHLLQILHGKKAAGFEFAFDNKIFDPLAGEIKEVRSVTPTRRRQRG